MVEGITTRSRFKVAHGASDFLDDADTLVSQNGSRLHSRHGATDHVEVSATDRACRKPHHRVIGLLNLWVRNVFELNIADSAKQYCVHESSFSTLSSVGGQR